ncbi:TonB-dependent receptor [Colwellia sp. MB3u-55]|uniref:TonB-dependent receptor n=1 Tax=Colwellia sp. MB3u-55 TaxID=2759810 RepID=UPI0015F78578|nr:TonB-dependent receptor [Colwellia sp. MB3u-55]MBA6252433.1 TonB-dependent receptor [Colwellia sp. MB3u-55]
MNTPRLSLITGAVVLALGLSTSAMAADTSSSIRGQILSNSGSPVTGATVTVIHIPTGSKKTVKLNESGVFSASGLRVGGPYKVIVDSNIYQDKTLENIFLQLGQTSQVSIELGSEEMERISVSGSSRHALIHGAKNGMGSIYGADDINRAPAFDRDLKDIIRQNPLVNISDSDSNEMSVGGVNPRFNSLSIDGVKQNDDFGLSANGYPTNGSPISLLSIAQVAIDITPFNAKASGFTGASINAVTKSGTNELFGELFYDYSSDSLAGTPKNEDGEDIKLDFTRKNYGMALGGKIIEDELFFFVSYEESKSPFVNNFGPGTANPKDWLTSDTITEVQNIASEVYGVNAGGIADGLSNDSEKLIVKLDWNINDDHRAAFTYQNTQDNSVRDQHTSSRNQFGLLSNWYNVDASVESYALQLYSYWTDELSTQLSVSFKDVENKQSSFSDALNDKKIGQACITIGESDERCSDRDSNSIWLGTDAYRHANQLTNDTLAIDFDGEYLLEEHVLSFGVGIEKTNVFNQFVPFSRGEWLFDSVEDFKNQNAERVSYSNAYTGNANDAAAEFSLSNFHLFVEDKWQINDELWVNAGVRYERISTSGTIRENEAFVGLYGFSNTNSLDGKDIFLPRFGFNWSVQDDLTLSGGIGRYYGGTPNVWISNVYSNDGQINVRANVNDVDLTNADITQPPAGATLTPGDGDVDAIDPNFELPSEWRVGLTANYTADLGPYLGTGWDLETSFMYVEEKDAVRWKELYRTTQESVVGPDGRVIPVGTGSRDRADAMVTNGEGGKRKIFTLSAAKAFDNGLYFNVSYANTDATSLAGGTSSTSNSNFSKYNTADRNNPQVGTSRYEIEHSFKLNLSYNIEMFEGYNSTFSLQGERSSGRPYSWVYDGGSNAFGGQNNYTRADMFLPYIPSGADDAAVTYADGYSYEQLKTVLDASGLTKYAGGIAPRNTETGPWNSRLDFKYSQEVPGFMEGHKGVLFVSVKNVLNLIDSSAGKVNVTNFTNARELVDINYDQDTNTYEYSEGFRDSAPTYYDAERSSWRIKVGISYKF